MVESKSLRTFPTAAERGQYFRESCLRMRVKRGKAWVDIRYDVRSQCTEQVEGTGMCLVRRFLFVELAAI